MPKIKIAKLLKLFLLFLWVTCQVTVESIEKKSNEVNVCTNPESENCTNESIPKGGSNEDDNRQGKVRRNGIVEANTEYDRVNDNVVDEKAEEKQKQVEDVAMENNEEELENYKIKYNSYVLHPCTDLDDECKLWASLGHVSKLPQNNYTKNYI